jgi:hypothetical protein
VEKVTTDDAGPLSVQSPFIIMRTPFLIFAIVAAVVPGRADTNSTALAVTPAAISDSINPDGTLRSKVTYESQAGDICVVSYNEGKNKIVMYGLPSTFAEGDSLDGIFYPAGTKIVGDKKYHAFAISKEIAASASKAHGNRIAQLEDAIAKDKKQWNLLDQIAAAEIKVDSSDPDINRLQDQKKQLDDEMANYKRELASLKQD